VDFLISNHNAEKTTIIKMGWLHKYFVRKDALATFLLRDLLTFANKKVANSRL